MLPPRIKKNRKTSSERVWKRHRKFVKGHSCCVPNCTNTNIEVAHVRTAANSGTGLKPHDRYTLSLCGEHHAEQHQTGVETFQAKYKIDLMALAAEFFLFSPDMAMKEALKDA